MEDLFFLELWDQYDDEDDDGGTIQTRRKEMVFDVP